MDFITKTVLGGILGAFGKSLQKIFGLFLTDKMVAIIVIGLLEMLVKSSKNTIDDKMLEEFKKQLNQAGIGV